MAGMLDALLGKPQQRLFFVLRSKGIANPVAPLDGRVRPERRPAGS